MMLRNGSTGNDVKKLQAFLRLTADGIFGNNTRNAVIAWQQSHGLSDDGIVGPQTWKEMGLEEKVADTKINISEAGINLIKEFEGCKLNAYVDPGTGAEPITIGYGNTFYEDGTKIKLGDTITQTQADTLLLKLLPKYEKIIYNKVTIPLQQNEHDALVSFVWNTGGSSTLFSKINNKASDMDIYNFWTTHYITAGGKQLAGLVKRRKIEAELYTKNSSNV